MTGLASRVLAACAAIGLALAASRPAAAADIYLVVNNVKNDRGHVRAALCDEARFGREGCPYDVTVPARAGTVELVFRDIPPGRYAIQLFEDENDNKKMDFTLLGLPKERFGFSNNARPFLSAPSFERAAFWVGDDDVTLTIELQDWN
ncbi:MAG: DUF2141 domain-containing protein [Pseudomonadota bacterium]